MTEVARARGVGETYLDFRGEPRSASPATLAALLRLQGIDVSDAGVIDTAPARVAARGSRRLIDATIVTQASQGVAWFGTTDDEVVWTITLEGGAVRSGRARPSPTGAGTRLPLPGDVAIGYHTLTVEQGGAREQASLIVVPSQCFEPVAVARGERAWGLAVQLYTLRSATNWGIGDFTDLIAFIREAANAGAAFVGLNPLHALFPSDPENCSPYSPSSRHFLNVLYIDVAALPEFANSEAVREHVAEPAFQQRLAHLRAATHVDYAGVAAAKFPVLRLLHDQFVATEVATDSPRARAYAAFCRERGESLERHARFDALMWHQRQTDPNIWGWPSWPEQYRSPASPAVRTFAQQHARLVDFFAWLQWCADQQLAAAQQVARELGMAYGLYADFAVGVNGWGAEAWSDQALFCLKAGIGAPPDALALKGQDWGLPPHDPAALKADGYRVFTDLLRASLRHCGILRLDHVMALCRQWWVPHGMGANDGGYVRYPLEDLMGVLALESQRAGALVCGEDLGTVPEDMSRAMEAYNVYSYKVLLFEKEGDAFRAPARYTKRALGTVSTHDLPTLVSWWLRQDIALRDKLGLYPDTAARDRVYAEREHDRLLLLQALHREGLVQTPDGEPTLEWLARSVHVYLARSATSLIAVQAEDVLGMADPVNIPGTSGEYPNWRRKLTTDIDGLFRSPQSQELFAELTRARAG